MIKNIIFPIEFNHFTGGMIHSVVALAKHLKTNYNVYFLAHKDAEVLTLDNEIKSLVLERPWSISILKPIKTFRTYLEVRKLLKPFDYENTIVFTNNVGSELILSGFGFFPISLRRIFVSRGGDYLGKTGWFLKKGFKNITRFVATSNKQRYALINAGVNIQLISIIHNGVNIKSSYIPKSNYNYNGSIRLSTLRYISANKNQLLAIDALRKLINKNFDVKLNLYGEAFSESDKYYKRIVDKKISELDLNNYVTLKGFEKDQSLIYNNTDILISTSLSEGFGRTVVEAMGYGIPCIGLIESGGLLDIIEHYVDGFLINNDSDELADTIIELLQNKQLYQKISVNALETYRTKFTEEIMGCNYKNFINEIL